jgi:hypothetical protein
LQSDELRVKIKELELIIESDERYGSLEDALYFSMAAYTKKLHIDQKRQEIATLSEILKQNDDPKERDRANKRIRLLEKEIEDLKR